MLEGFPIAVRHTVQWGEMDAFGHVNNARYFTWFESARIVLLERLGLATAGAPERGPILASTRCDFLVPVTFPAEIVTATRVTRIGTSSFTMEYAVALAAPGAPGDPSGPPERLAARGEGVVVLVDYRTGKSVPIPPPMRERLEAHR